jgi:predicted nucleic acid-binding Zn ribbon protein
VSVASPPSAGGATPAGAPPYPPSGEGCPLCGAPLHADQEWCLRCGAAARTRLAASPKWKGLTSAIAVVVVLSLGVLAAALVSLASGTGAPPAAITRTVTAAAAPAATTTAPASTAPASTAATSTAATAPAK